MRFAFLPQFKMTLNDRISYENDVRRNISTLFLMILNNVIRL